MHAASLGGGVLPSRLPIFVSAKLGTKVSGSALAASYFRDRPVFSHARSLSEVFRNLGEGLTELTQWSVLDKEGGYLTRVLATALDQGFVCSERSVPSEVLGSRSAYHSPGDLEARYDEALVEIEAIHDKLTTELFDHPLYGPSSESQGMPAGQARGSASS